MTKQFYLSRLEKGIKIMNMYHIMIQGQQNYKTLPHYMKTFGDFCIDYLKYKTIENSPQVHSLEKVDELLTVAQETGVEIVATIGAYASFIQKCKDLYYTDVAECMREMTVTDKITQVITEEIETQN